MYARVAAIIVNWNSWSHLEIALQCIKKQTTAFHRIIVIDNASEDTMPVWLQSWLECETFKIVRQSENVGFSKANNLAIELASDCEYVALINPDAKIDRRWLENILVATDMHEDAASFGSCLLMDNDKGIIDGLGDIYHISGRVRRDQHGSQLGDLEHTHSEIFSPCAAAALYRRQILVDVGGFDEDYFCYIEDVDLGFRLQLSGFTSFLVPQAIAYHVGSASTGGQHSDFSVYYGHRNLVWTFVKDMPGILFWLLLPLHLVLNLVTVIWYTWEGRGTVILRAKWHALKGIRGALRKRRLIQRNRQCQVGKIWHKLDKRVFIWK